MILPLSTTTAQLDIVLDYQRPHFTDWDQVLTVRYQDETPLFAHVFGAGVAYRYFPFDFRLGFAPEAGVSYRKESRSNSFHTSDYQWIQSTFYLPLQVFPFDFYGDCNCPTFGRQNDFFKKAIYFKLIPSVSINLLQFGDSESVSSTDVSWGVGGGIGMNIAMSELITLAPEFSYHERFGHKWDGFSAAHEQPDALDDTAAYGLRFSIRISFYFIE